MKKRYSAGQSFGEDELQLLDFILKAMIRGADPRMATRHKSFASICRKVLAMRGERPAPERALRATGRRRMKDAPMTWHYSDPPTDRPILGFDGERAGLCRCRSTVGAFPWLWYFGDWMTVSRVAPKAWMEVPAPPRGSVQP